MKIQEQFSFDTFSFLQGALGGSEAGFCQLFIGLQKRCRHTVLKNPSVFADCRGFPG